LKGDIKNLYPAIIKAHNANPYHFEKKALAESVRAYNPICGDRFDFFIEWCNGRIAQLYFHGFGCAISKASSSIMVKALEGKTVEESVVLCKDFLEYLDNQAHPDNFGREYFRAFAAVRDFPARYDCAALSWIKALEYLKNITQ